jgi:hypothetical protein
MNNSEIIQSVTTILVAAITGLFGLIIARMQNKKSIEQKPTLYLPSGASSSKLKKEPKLQYVLLIAVFTVIGGISGYFIGGNISKPDSSPKPTTIAENFDIFDDFNNPSLDSSIWERSEGDSTPTVNNSILSVSRDSDGNYVNWMLFPRQNGKSIIHVS